MCPGHSHASETSELFIPVEFHNQRASSNQRWPGVTRTPRAFPEAQHGFTGLFLIIKKGRSRQGAFSALNLDYLGKPYVLGAENCSDVLSQAAAQPHRVRTCCTLHRHVSMVLLKRCGESHVTPIRSQAARDGRRRKRHKRHLFKYPGEGKGLIGLSLP